MGKIKRILNVGLLVSQALELGKEGEGGSIGVLKGMETGKDWKRVMSKGKERISIMGKVRKEYEERER